MTFTSVALGVLSEQSEGPFVLSAGCAISSEIVALALLWRAIFRLKPSAFFGWGTSEDEGDSRCSCREGLVSATFCHAK